MMISVCLISGEYPPMQGGVGDYTSRLAGAMVDQGAEVSVLTSRSASEEETFSVYPEIAKWDFSSYGVISDCLKARGPLILHIQYQAAAYGLHPAINLLPWRLRLFARRPKVVVTFHDLLAPYILPKAGPLRRGAVWALAKGSDAVIVIDRGDEAKLRSWGVGSHFIPIGSNITPAPPRGYDRGAWRRRLGVEEGETLLSYFGFLNWSKGVELLVRALGELMEGGQKVKLLMVGGKVGSSDPTNIEYARYIEGLIRELGLGERVIWTEYVSQDAVSANLMASDICVLPYREGASTRRGTLMAALAHGLPIVSTCPSPQDTDLVDGKNIALVPPQDVEALVVEIRELTSSPALRRRLAEGAGALAVNFEWDSIARRTVEVYQGVLERGSNE